MEMEKILAHVKSLVEDQIERNKNINSEDQTPMEFDHNSLITIGLIDGDGIGPVIMDATMKVLEKILADKIASNKVILKRIKGLTIENRIAEMAPVPADVLSEIKECHLLLKGPTMTPGKGDNLPNIESANVGLRKALDLFANVRPVSLPEKNINWVFFRENTEGEYALGGKGVEIAPDISMDFKVTTDAGTDRLARAAFKYAKENGNLKVSVITKANIIKKTDGKFLERCGKIAEEFPSVPWDSWYVDITAANLINEKRNKDFNVFLLPNLYGDIITDEAAQMQGGVGPAGSANIGAKYAMFEAIHGSAPRMMKDGRGNFANPASLLRAAEMMLRHIAMSKEADSLDKALNLANDKLNMTGYEGGNTASDFADFVIKNL